MKRTVEVENELNISRQSLQNYIRNGEIDKPKKDKRGYLWSSKNIIQVKKIMKLKADNQKHLLRKERTLEIQNRRYLGSKQRMLNFIANVVRENTENITSVADIFGGTGVVADMFNKQGKKVIVNDLLYSNFICYETWFGNEKINLKSIDNQIKYLNNLSGISGYVTENFGNRYFSEENAQKIDAIREEIDKINHLNNREKSCLLTSLIYAMDKVANTVGHYDAYRKKVDNNQKLFLRTPKVQANVDNEIYNMDANKLVRDIYADLVYIDTPYNSRGYENAYHVLENIAEWKKPEVEGIARKAVNRSEKGSAYTKSKAPAAFADLIEGIHSRYILVSYNNMEKKGNSRSNAKISGSEIFEILSRRGNVQIFETDFSPFTAGKSQIKGHKELLYLCEIQGDENEKSLY